MVIYLGGKAPCLHGYEDSTCSFHSLVDWRAESMTTATTRCHGSTPKMATLRSCLRAGRAGRVHTVSSPHAVARRRHGLAGRRRMLA